LKKKPKIWWLVVCESSSKKIKRERRGGVNNHSTAYHFTKTGKWPNMMEGGKRIE